MVGFVAGALMTSGQAAQLYKMKVTGKAEDVSGLFIVISILGTVLYLIYGWNLGAYAMLVWCGISFIILSWIFLLKYRDGWTRHKEV